MAPRPACASAVSGEEVGANVSSAPFVRRLLAPPHPKIKPSKWLFSRLFSKSSTIVVVVADADHVGHIVIFFLFFGEEGVVIVVAEVDIVVIVAQIR